MTKRTRVSIYASKEEHDKIKFLSEKFNISISSMSTTLIKLGLLAFEVATDPKLSKIYEKKINEVLDEKNL